MAGTFSLVWSFVYPSNISPPLVIERAKDLHMLSCDRNIDDIYHPLYTSSNLSCEGGTSFDNGCPWLNPKGVDAWILLV